VVEVAHMEQFQRVGGFASFAPFAYEYQVPLPTEQAEQLEDVGLRLAGRTSAIGAVPVGRVPQGVRVYWGSADLTESFVAVLRSLIAALPEDTFREQYQAGIDAWIATATRLGTGYPGDLSIDRSSRERLLALSPSDLLNQLGAISVSPTVKAGSRGYLHVFNFLDNYVKVPAVSLAAVLEAHNARHGTFLTLIGLVREPITLSFGPCRLFDPDWDPTNVPGGCVVYDIALRYHNTADDEIAELKRRVHDLETDVANLTRAVRDLTNRLRGLVSSFQGVVDDLAATGPIRTSLDDTSQSVDAMIVDLGRSQAALGVLTDAVNQFDHRIQALEAGIP
jgi:hypothetical protein